MAESDADDIKLSDDLEEAESPFLRRRKAVAVRRSRFSRRIRKTAGWFLFTVFIFLPIAFGGYTLARYVRTSPRFQLNSPQDVKVYGNHFVAQDDILNVLGVTSAPGFPSEMNIFRISLVVKERQVESIPWVKSASVVRTFPHGLAVYVTERKPVAFVNVGGHIKLVDAEGIILEKPDKGDTFDFPVLYGLDDQEGSAGRKIRIDLYQEFERQTTPEVPRSGWIVSEVDLSDPEDIKTLLVQGNETLLLHFGHEDFLQRFRNFLTLLPELEKSNSKIDSIDLRYGNQVVVEPARPGKGESKSP